MTEFTSNPEQQPRNRSEMAADIFNLVSSRLPWDGPGVHQNWYGERTAHVQLNGIGVAELKRFPYSGFLDHNFPDPVRRLRASVAIGDAEFTVWDMDPVEPGPETPTDPVISDPEVFVTRGDAPETRREISKAIMGTALAKIRNHATTFGVFIGGVEQERRQRLFNRLHRINIQAGVTKPATDDEVQQLLALLETPEQSGQG